MQASAEWFFGLATLAAASLLLGWWLGRGSAGRAWTALLIGIGLLFTSAWLVQHPSVAVRVIPAGVVGYLEGTAAVPFFMLILGVAWARARIPRQKRLLVLAMAMGAVFFIQGGFWMLQTTPRTGFAQATSGDLVVLQSQDYSCVPASCATALNIMGLPSSEAEMADLTQTRAGTGATIVRAMAGLTQRLTGSGITVRMVEPTIDQLLTLPTPIVTTVNFSGTKRYCHMVVLTKVNREGARMADPVDGEFFVPRAALGAAYQGQALVFDRPR